MKSIGRGRPWFQFTLRALFGLTLVTCVFGAWVARERQLVYEQMAAAESIRQIGGTAMFCHQYAPDDEKPSLRDRLRKALVREKGGNVNYVSVRGSSVADEEIACLCSLSDLKALTIADSRVTDNGMKALESLPLLESLSLEDAKISDSSLSCLSGLTQLKRLDLSGTGITDAGLVHLRTLTHLRNLKLDGTHVTADGANRLLEYLPKLKVSL
jgi:Leucine-rich repeat (LRR) protein